MPKVSVILPNYNHEQFLPQRIDSILNQTYSDFELLMMDDKSPDNSVAVLQSYLTDPRARLEINEVNTGNTYLQWIKGLSMTSGDYVWIAESDDYADLTFLEKLVAALDANPSVGIATCAPYDIDGAGRVLGDHYHHWDQSFLSSYGPYPFKSGPFFMKGRDYCARYMYPFNTIPNASGILMRRSAIEAIGGPVTTMKICGDWFTYCKMLMQSDIYYVGEFLNYFRTHTQNVRVRSKGHDYIRESYEVCRWLETALGHPPRPQTQRAMNNFFNNILVGAERSPPDNKVPIGRMGAVMRTASEFGPAMVARVTSTMVKEKAAAVVAPLRGRS